MKSDPWSVVAAALVGFHLCCEYVHYLWDFFKGKKMAKTQQEDSKILSEIQNHRKQSTKTARLSDIQKDICLIKEHLGIPGGDLNA